MPDNGLVTIPSPHSVDETVARIQRILEARHIKLFAIIDHSGEAESAGLHMPPTRLLIFGNPKGGTPIMLATPSAAIDLPLKLLVAQDAAGHVLMSWNSPTYLHGRHDFPEEFLRVAAAAEDIAKSAAAP